MNSEFLEECFELRDLLEKYRKNTQSLILYNNLDTRINQEKIEVIEI